MIIPLSLQIVVNVIYIRVHPGINLVHESQDNNNQFPGNTDVAGNRTGQGWTLCGGEIDYYCLETYQIDKQVLGCTLSLNLK